MKKYGFNDYEWNNGCECWNKFCQGVTLFNLNVFIPFMKRKTMDKKDVKMLEALAEMVTMMIEHAKETKKR